MNERTPQDPTFREFLDKLYPRDEIAGEGEPLPFQIDRRLTPGQVRQFAEQTQYVEPPFVDWMTKAFKGDETREFYEGQLAALSAMYQMVRQLSPQEVQRFDGQILALLASYLVERENL
jgi:hypothetical protein